MARPFQRRDRLKSLFERELTNLFQTSLKDPIFEGQSIQVTNILLAKDISSARVFISVVNKDREVSIINSLQDRAPLIQGQLGRKMHLKRIPKFVFIQDDSIAKTTYINSLLDKLKNEA